ncbi:LysR family transcriptional regulator [Vibrio diabolicus]|uniref:LysR family transcriptional regulator n=1 Tax=Vibrio diabolicus TaxID=50719 RepID=UPI00215C1A3F|nr:LysR family transcriptional regulator [Vibrio diabolicus]MCR9302004.1 LysR family transcriptional regulator [Vibrio diabolicus]MCR9424094.1 LysR family transcriptional regulator [Vibrio diabolicus]
MDNLTARSLSRIDLNLLVTLDVLMRELNVTRAANEMCVSQSTMSYSLQRLRDTFDDPLFTRTAKGLIPTKRALELNEALPELLSQLNSLVIHKPFEPFVCQESFSIALPTFLSSIVIPTLVRKLRQVAPNVNLIEVPIKSNQLALLDQGTLDFLVHYEESGNKSHLVELVGRLSACLYVRNGHPLLLEPSPSLQQILQFPVIGMHVEQDFYNTFDAPLEQLLEQQEIEKIGMIRSTQTQTLIDIMLESDSVLFGASVLKKYKGYGDSFQLIMPLDEWSVPMNLIQHKRNAGSEAQTWFRQILSDELSKVLG